MFDGSLVHCNSFSVTVKLLNRLDNNIIHVTNIYGPTTSSQKLGLRTWLMSFNSNDFDNWVLGGDFNLYRHPEKKQIRWGHC